MVSLEEQHLFLLLVGKIDEKINVIGKMSASLSYTLVAE